MARPIRAGAGDRQTESSHADLISRVVEGQDSDAKAGVVDSWRRSLTQHHVEPATASAPNVLTERELKDLREPFRSVLMAAQEEVDHLFAIVRRATRGQHPRVNLRLSDDDVRQLDAASDPGIPYPKWMVLQLDTAEDARSKILHPERYAEGGPWKDLRGTRWSS